MRGGFRATLFVVAAAFWLFRGEVGAASAYTVGIFFLPLLDDREEG